VADLIGCGSRTEQKRQLDELAALLGSIPDDSTGRWGCVGSTFFQGVPILAVRQSYHVHREIAAFLERQREVIRAARQAAVPRCPVVDIGRTPAVEKIEKALKEPTDLEFIETPLWDVILYLKKKHKIEIQIDRKALDDVGLDSWITPITKNLKGISLRSALRLTLRDLDLTYVIQDEVLLITTPEEAETRLTTRVYPVGDLWGSFRPPLATPFLFPTGIPVVGTWSEQAEPPQDSARPAESGADPSPESAPEAPTAAPRVGTLADMISWTVKPTTWEEVGGPGTITIGSVGGVDVLIVCQTQEVHEQILDLLDTLREAIRCSRSPAAPAAKPAAGEPPTDEPPEAPPAPEPPAADPNDGEPAETPAIEPAAEPPDDPFPHQPPIEPAPEPAPEPSIEPTPEPPDDPFDD
ncbi:MAG: hypothetical protein ACYSWU_23965, partial [Planctomycetota bacterium]|jgi:hypothetical protein